MNEAKKGCPSAKEIFWRNHFDSWKASALSQQEYCRQHQLALATFGYWRRKLKDSSAIKPRFYPLALPPKIAASDNGAIRSSLRLTLCDNRFAIEIDEDFSPAALQLLVRALEQV